MNVNVNGCWISSRLLWMLHRWWRRWLEALQQEGRVDNKRDRQSYQGVHEYIQFGLTETILAQPFEHFIL